MIRYIEAPLVALSFKNQLTSSVHLARQRSTFAKSQVHAIDNQVASAKKRGENINEKSIPSDRFEITHYGKRKLVMFLMLSARIRY